MRAEELLRLHLAAMFTTNPAGRLVAVNEPWDQSQPAPLAFAAVDRDGGRLLCLGAGLAEAAAERARQLHRAGAEDPAAYLTALGGARFSQELCYSLPQALPAAADCIPLDQGSLAGLDPGPFGWLAGELALAQPCLVYAPQGRILSVCRSVRLGQGHEAGIETDPASRGKGYAGKVLAAWAGAVRQRGSVPLYSTLVENTASRRLAAKLGLEQYATGFSIW